jgi:hypothetical protein
VDTSKPESGLPIGKSGFPFEHSPTTGALLVAFFKALAKMPPPLKDKNNPHLKSTYADLASVHESTKAYLQAEGLGVTQIPSIVDGVKITVTTLLYHLEKGEWLSFDLTMVAKDAMPQSVGSVITYGRRYSLLAFCGLAPDDDDGDAATGHPRASNGTRRINATYAQALAAINKCVDIVELEGKIKPYIAGHKSLDEEEKKALFAHTANRVTELKQKK